MCVEALGVTKRQLEDFLPGGKFEDMDEWMKEQLMHYPLTNLVGESAFGDFDFDVCKRRNASLHIRSSMHSIKRNKTVKFISSKSRSQIKGQGYKKRKCQAQKRGEFSQFADFLLSIGDGKEEQHKNK